MSNNKRAISVIVPVVHEDKARVCVAAVQANIGSDFEYELLVEKDENKVGCPKMVKSLVEKAQHELICFLGDDCIPQEGFMLSAVKTLDEKTGGKGVVFFQDGTFDVGLQKPNHFVFHRSLLEKLDGEIFHTGYIHSFCDNELAERTFNMGLAAFDYDSIVYHDNPLLFKNRDGLLMTSYADVYSNSVYAKDMILFGRRRANGWKTPDADWFKLGIGLPLMDETVDKRFLVSFQQIYKPFDWVFMIPRLKPLKADFVRVRNELLNQAMLNGCSHIVMMDTDQIYPQDTLTKLITHKDKDIVGALVHRRYPPFDALLFRGKMMEMYHVPDEECFSGNLVKVDATGTGCLMIKLDILPDMDFPWFEVVPEKGIGEDIYFCNNATNHGKEVYVDTGIQIEHITTYIVNRSTYELFKKIHTDWEWRPVGMLREKTENEDYFEKIQNAKQKFI